VRLHCGPQTAYNDEDLFAPLVLPGRAARLDELDEALDESLTPARIVGWISDTIWGGDASDEEDEVSVESSAV
jgi:hypothetical protein